jgi:hypothetical protein
VQKTTAALASYSWHFAEGDAVEVLTLLLLVTLMIGNLN